MFHQPGEPVFDPPFRRARVAGSFSHPRFCPLKTRRNNGLESRTARCVQVHIRRDIDALNPLPVYPLTGFTHQLSPTGLICSLEMKDFDGQATFSPMVIASSDD
jgi:hypothetical protein